MSAFTTQPPEQPSAKPRNAYGRDKRRKELEQFVQELNTAIDQYFPSNDKPYGQVAVLAFHWENDDLGVLGLETELLNTFRNRYNFSVESFEIPNISNATVKFNRKIWDFADKWDAEDALLIFVYSGHAGQADAEGTRYILGGALDDKGNLTGATINWFGSCKEIEDADADILYIFDTCFAASAALYDGPEVLAASSWGDFAGIDLQKSFTRILIDELIERDGAPCTVAELYSSIHRNATATQLEQGPVHIPRKNKESITLAKKLPPKQRKPETQEARRLKVDELGAAEERVLITVHLQEKITIPSLHEWKKWLTNNIPSRILRLGITVEGNFQTNSTLLLLNVPVGVWTMLPADDPTYTFVSFVRSSNQLVRAAVEASAPLALRQSGRENQPPAHKRGHSYGGPARTQ